VIELGLFLTGLLAGILGALLGLGGGIFLVPALTLFYHLPIRLAVGTSLMAVIATSAGVAAVARPGRGADVSLALKLESSTAAGAIAGGWFAALLSSGILSVTFALVTFVSAGYLLSKSRKQSPTGIRELLFAQNYRIRNWPVGLTVAAGAGVISGLLGVGGGFIKVPIMYSVMGVPLGVATATSNFMVGITAAASVFVYYGRGDLRPLIVVPAVIGVFCGAMIGVYIVSRLRVAWIRTALAALLIIMGLQMLLHGIRNWTL
jgi:uncharacterized membrane protein YfcA